MMLIRESINGELDVTMNYKESKINLTESVLPINTIDPNSIMVDIESIHEYPFNTRNYTRYHENALLSSIPTWTKPYNRPVILHHNEKNGRIIGRVVNAFYKKDKTLSDTPALVLTINVPDEEAKKEIKNGILKTTSIGVLVHDCRCSICGQNIAEEGECEHERGVRYDGQICYWDIYDMEAKELSYVIVPSDIYAQNIRIYNVNDNKSIKESNNMKGATTMSVSLKENSNTIIDENGDTNKPAISNIDYKAKFEELKKEYEDFKSNVDGDMENTNEKLKKELNNTKVLLSQAQKSLVDVENELTIKKADFLKEQSLRENLENDLEECNKDLKESLLNNVLILRNSLNKPEIKKDSLIERSVDSLKDSILDLQEEMGTNKTNSVNINESSSNKSTKSSNSIKEAAQASVPENPSLVQEKEDKDKSITESTEEDYDFDNEMQDIMKSLYD